MATYYADSSVLVKRHVAERGTSWVQALTDPMAGHDFLTSRCSVVEVASALNRRQRDVSLSAAQYARISADFAALCATDYQLVDVSAQIVDRAWRLLEQHPLRAYGAVQLVSVILTDTALRTTGTPALTFLAADDRLLAAAQLEGLAVDNPIRHP